MTILAERPTTWTLVEQAQAGDMAAFAQLYDTYYDTVIRFIRARVDSLPTAQDLAGDVFVRALRSIGTVEWQGRDLGAWLMTIARNVVFDELKCGRVRTTFPAGCLTDDDDLPRHQQPTGGDEQFDAVVDADRYATIRRAVSCLRGEQRQCVELRFFEGLSLVETAAVMGKNVNAVKALQFRAISTLRRLLAGLAVTG